MLGVVDGGGLFACLMGWGGEGVESAYGFCVLVGVTIDKGVG